MSTLRVNNITDTSGGSSSLSVPGAAKAWVNFNGTGTVAIRAQLNVSSITDNGVGNYTVNFTTAMPDADYTFVTSNRIDAATTEGNNGYLNTFCSTNTAPTASALRLVTPGNVTSSLFDALAVTVAVFR